MPIDQPARNNGLRELAERAWRTKRELNESRLEDRIAEEERLLRKKLIELGAAEDEIAIKHMGGRIIAEVEGLRLVSAYGDPWLCTFSIIGESKLPGVLLRWTCPNCGEVKEGKVIREPVDLGEELAHIETGMFHRCMRDRSLQ
jgi:hypothetical protein